MMTLCLLDPVYAESASSTTWKSTNRSLWVQLKIFAEFSLAYLPTSSES